MNSKPTVRRRLKSPMLINAEEMARQPPKSFGIPEGRHSLKAGDLAKVACNHERFWCIVTYAKDGIYKGEVNNHLINTAGHGLSCGDIIRFSAANIHQCMREGTDVLMD